MTQVVRQGPRARGTGPDRTWLVAVAAAFWGLSGLWRDPLALRFPALAVVFWEHLVLTVIMLPWLLPALRRLWASRWRTRVAMAIIGVGSSALATVLFTAAFAVGDPVTPQVLQKLQPLIAVSLAALLLGERLRARYLCFALPALAGAWLLTFPDPLAVSLGSARAGLLALGAATLWAAGTVLGRAVSDELRFIDTVALRFAFGLLALGAVAGWRGTPLMLDASAVPALLALVLLPGLAAMSLYYLALGRTRAARATLAELTFPVTAALVGVLALGARLELSQWAGMGLVLLAVVGLATSGGQGAVTGPLRTLRAGNGGQRKTAQPRGVGTPRG